jgi:hypothetical protein
MIADLHLEAHNATGITEAFKADNFAQKINLGMSSIV